MEAQLKAHESLAPLFTQLPGTPSSLASISVVICRDPCANFWCRKVRDCGSDSKPSQIFHLRSPPSSMTVQNRSAAQSSPTPRVTSCSALPSSCFSLVHLSYNPPRSLRQSSVRKASGQPYSSIMVALTTSYYICEVLVSRHDTDPAGEMPYVDAAKELVFRNHHTLDRDGLEGVVFLVELVKDFDSRSRCGMQIVGRIVCFFGSVSTCAVEGADCALMVSWSG